MRIFSYVGPSAFGIALLCLLPGCVNLNPPKENQVTSQDGKPLDIRRGASTFAHFCYGTAPSFAGLEEEALSGSYERAQNGWLEHFEFNLDMVVRDHGDFKSCQLNFESQQPVNVFEEIMAHPFNARELPKAEYRKLFRSEFDTRAFDFRINKVFASRATFADRDTSAMFYGFVLDNPQTQAGANSFGLILQVEQ